MPTVRRQEQFHEPLQSRQIKLWGHDVVPATRANGVDTASGKGLDEALDGADTVVDCTNYTTLSARKAINILGAMSTNVVAAATRARVSHLVLLSIINVATPALRGMGYYQGKAAQERIVAAGDVPYTIVRTTQWFELARDLRSQARLGSFAFLPHMRSVPMAATAAAEVLCEVATEAPQKLREVGGPEELDLFDVAKKLAASEEPGLHLLPMLYPGVTKALAGGALLPGPGVERRGPAFAGWLSSQ